MLCGLHAVQMFKSMLPCWTGGSTEPSRQFSTLLRCRQAQAPLRVDWIAHDWKPGRMHVSTLTRSSVPLLLLRRPSCSPLQATCSFSLVSIGLCLQVLMGEDESPLPMEQRRFAALCWGPGDLATTMVMLNEQGQLVDVLYLGQLSGAIRRTRRNAQGVDDIFADAAKVPL